MPVLKQLRAALPIGLGAALALWLGACGKEAGKPPAVEKESARAAQVAPVQKKFLTVEAITAADAVDVLALPGRIAFRAQAQSAVGATVAGRVVQVLVRAGEAVKAGAPLLTIESADASSARAAFDQADTRLAAAESSYRRNLERVQKGVGLESERQEAEARLKEARTEHERARQGVALIGAGLGSRVTVRAPSNGVVMTLRVAVGATVAPGGEALIEVGDPSRLQAVADVPESELQRVAIGQEAEIEVPAYAARWC